MGGPNGSSGNFVDPELLPARYSAMRAEMIKCRRPACRTAACGGTSKRAHEGAGLGLPLADGATDQAGDRPNGTSAYQGKDDRDDRAGDDQWLQG